MVRRPLSILAAVLACATIAGCSKAPAFADTVTFDRETLVKATEWSRGGLSGVVYVPPGQSLPRASLQVGAIVSTEHTTGAALHQWVEGQSVRSGAFLGHSSGGAEESCRTGMITIESDNRFYITLQVCKTGVARAACVEADETLEQRAFERCISDSGCFQDICDERWLTRREALDLLVADVLAKRPR